MIASDTKGLLYSDIIDENLAKLFQMGIDLKPFFSSPLPYHKVDSYPEYHIDDRELLLAINLDSLASVKEGYHALANRL